jgi:hypothetical protein
MIYYSRHSAIRDYIYRSDYHLYAKIDILGLKWVVILSIHATRKGIKEIGC